jgi:hypothetical protein
MTDDQLVLHQVADSTHIPGLLQSHDGTTVESGQDGPHGRKVVQIQALLRNVSFVARMVQSDSHPPI